MFVSPGAYSKAWRHARQWLAVDATFMKTKHQLRLHLAAAMDGTGSLILLAWALSPGESQDNWEWFMLNLRQSLKDLDASSATINLKDHRFSAAAGRVFWQMVYAPTKSKFDGYMDTLVRLDKDAADYVKGIDATKWATYAVPGRRFGHVTSNLAEIANAMLLDARELPPLQLTFKTPAA
ncbi:unnamed protein product [Tilletia controversa]|nr:hypothetical protein CF328_g6970 [Tilletia controversa]CAD6977317.1 unnamed protein product [Tilletia controversa]